MRHTERRKKISQKKSLGQVFLREDWPCEKMVESLKAVNIENVIEIGPGLGVLTRILLAQGINVLAIEKDDRFAERLADTFKDSQAPGQLTIVNTDVLKFDLSEWVRKTPGRKAVCGNIPYNISSPILTWLLPEMAFLKSANLMVQLEFAERVAAHANTKSYGSLSVFVQLRSRAKIAFKISRSCFHPVPKVDSAVIVLKPLNNISSDTTLKKVEQITRKAFSQRRKKLSNSLQVYLKERQASELPIDLSRRCDSLSPEDFVLLAEALFEKK